MKETGGVESGSRGERGGKKEKMRERKKKYQKIERGMEQRRRTRKTEPLKPEGSKSVLKRAKRCDILFMNTLKNGFGGM